MIQRSTIIILLAASLSAFDFTDIPKEYGGRRTVQVYTKVTLNACTFAGLIPPDSRNFMSNLSAEDKVILKDVFSRTNYGSEEEALFKYLLLQATKFVIAALKAKSAKLGDGLEKINTMVKTKIAALGPEAQSFTSYIVNTNRNLRNKLFADAKPSSSVLKEAAKGIVARYKALSSNDKADFKKQFPNISEALSNERLLQRLEETK
ncbi:unnamed protein product [Strongylus vulgaris]|uniref:Fatty-acid and retinol-binding protein 1 n=1 Tax=Strongylus vulgaris TaxID=40348 RepID=A0A3P7IUN0_STRVU|nr:unnamed protein product [Strongylus vulgaris]